MLSNEFAIPQVPCNCVFRHPKTETLSDPPQVSHFWFKLLMVLAEVSRLSCCWSRFWVSHNIPKTTEKPSSLAGLSRRLRSQRRRRQRRRRHRRRSRRQLPSRHLLTARSVGLRPMKRRRLSPKKWQNAARVRALRPFFRLREKASINPGASHMQPGCICCN